MASKLDFAAALGEQLKAAGAQMRAMRVPKDETPAAPEAAEHPAPDVQAVPGPTMTPASTPPETAHASVAAATDDETAPSPAAPYAAEDVPTVTETVAEALTRTVSSGASPEARHPGMDAAHAHARTASVPHVAAPEAGQTAMKAVPGAVTETVTTTPLRPEPERAAPSAETSAPPRAHEAGQAISPTFPHEAPATAETPSSDAGIGRHAGTAMPPSVASGVTPDPAKGALAADGPAAPSPALSERAWRGGVRGAVLDMLHQLAPGQDHVLVNLKRLAAHMGISYGSVRNAMSRLAQSGDISTRQIRVADGHGVRVDFQDDPTRQNRRGHSRRETGTGQGRSQRAARSPGSAESPRGQGGDPTGNPSFWDTPDEIFLLAWPHAAAAGVSMDVLRSLRAVFAAQGFSETGLPRSLRHLDWQLEQLERAGTGDSAAAASLVEASLSRLRRQGYLPRPQGYEDPEMRRLREEAEERRAHGAPDKEHH